MLFKRKKKDDYKEEHALHRDLEQILIMVGFDAMQLTDRTKVSDQDRIDYVIALECANLDNRLGYTNSIKIHLKYILCYLKALKEEKPS